MAEVILYTTPTCGFCMRAKYLLTNLGASYKEINVVENREEHVQLKEKYNWHTVPMIFIGGEFIGGFDDMAALHAKGLLTEKINA